MNLTARLATTHTRCALCQDGIIPGELIVTLDCTTNPDGECGDAHTDCALAAGHTVDAVDPDDIEAVLRIAFRRVLRRQRA